MLWCMQRTNIYLAEDQIAALDQVARDLGVSRAELVRTYIERGLSVAGDSIDDDLTAISDSFGVLGPDAAAVPRGAGDREQHLDRIRGG